MISRTRQPRQCSAASSATISSVTVTSQTKSCIWRVVHEWLWAAVCFVGGYLLQFIGHAVEGNDAGEVILVKKLLGLHYVEFGPRPGADEPVKD